MSPKTAEKEMALGKPIIKLHTMGLYGIGDVEKDLYSDFKISNGYGMLSKAGVTVQKGIIAHLDVTFIMKSISTQDMTSWLSQNKSYFSDEQWHTLEENHAAGGFLGGVLGGAFGFLFGGGTYNHYKNAHDKEVKVDDSSKEGFLKSLHNVTRTKVEVSGSIDAVGTSMMPTTGFCFVETTSIEFKDGSTLTVVNSSNPIVAQQDGNTQGLETPENQKLEIIPIT